MNIKLLLIVTSLMLTSEGYPRAKTKFRRQYYPYFTYGLAPVMSNGPPSFTGYPQTSFAGHQYESCYRKSEMRLPGSTINHEDHQDKITDPHL